MTPHSLGHTIPGVVRRLAVLFGDQLDNDPPGLDGLDKSRDAILMAEVADEATHVASHKQRTVLFLSGMRHRATELSQRGWRVRYVRLDDPDNTQTLSGEVRRAVRELDPAVIRVARPGDHRVLEAVETCQAATGTPVEVVEDSHFLTTPAAFAEWADGRKRLTMEHFYRAQRRRLNILLDDGGGPVGGRWNLDRENRQSFGDPPESRAPRRFEPDEVTREVIDLVERRFPDAPGRITGFGWPVTRRDAKAVLRDFLKHRFARFGPYQDAMWTGEPFLYHSLLSPALNLKLLSPTEVLQAALDRFERDDVPLASAEGFVRQVIGWREFIRGVYWREGPAYGDRNALEEDGQLPWFYWTGETEMQCLAESIGQVLEHGYGHHIQRLMVTGNFALLAGVRPRAVADWYLGMYVDGVDWVTAPNTIGMVMHADGGIVGTKPYAASGQYIKRMSNYCASCRFNPSKRTGPDACPITSFYWDFLLRHRKRFDSNRRMRLMLGHVDRMDRSEQRAVRRHADQLRAELGVAP